MPFRRIVAPSVAALVLVAAPLAAQEPGQPDRFVPRHLAVALVAPTAVALRAVPASSVTIPVATTSPVPTASDAMGHEALPAPAPADGFASSGFAQFMASPAGRILRVAAGAGMIAGGLSMDSDGGTALAIAGGLPLLAGALDFCVLSPLLGGPFWGKDIRAAK